MKKDERKALDRIETTIDDISNFIQEFRDGNYYEDNEFWSDIIFNAECIKKEANKMEIPKSKWTKHGI